MSENSFDWLSEAFTFLSNTQVMGVSLTTILCILLLLSAVVLFIRGNK